MEWRIRKCPKGGYVAEYGTYHAGGVQIDNHPGVTMPAFIVYQAAWHETEKQAKRYIERNMKGVKR